MANRSLTFEKKFKDYDLDIHGVRLPQFEIDNTYKHRLHVSEDCNNFDFLRKLCLTGFNQLNVEKDSELYNKYVERAKYELNTLKELGFIDYTLLVWDVINFCKENDIPTGLGRGSAAGSLVLFLIGVTGVDPIRHDLYFERFVSKIRAKKTVVDGVTYLDGSLMCDVDLDICYYRRQEVIQYLENKFKGKTAKIITMNTLSGKLLIKECGKIVAEKNETEMNGVSALIPKTFGQVMDIEEAYKEEDKFRDWCDDNKTAYKVALKLRGLIKNKGVHPSAISLSYEKMEDSCPAELTSAKDSSVSSYDMNWISIFNVKLDLLGLRSVSVVDDVCKQVGLSLNELDLNDPLIYRQLQDLKTPHGCFQIEADTNYKVCQKVMPKNIEELSAVLALARPGAMQFVDQYALYVNSDTYEPIHPFFDDTLKETGGVALYQEQLMKMANKVGFTLDEAEILRRIVGKKKRAEVKKWKNKISDKIKENKLDPEIGDILWQILEDSANYSFNKSHSMSYAALAAATVYLKFKYPQQFFLSLLKMTRHEPDPISEIAKIHTEMSEFDIKLLPPHLTRSEMDFSIEGDDIRFGLLSIKGISEKSIEKINNFKNTYSDKFEVFMAAKESKLNIGVLSALIQAGALEGFKQSRSKVVLEAQLWNLLTDRERRYVMNFAKQMDYDLVEILKFLMKFKDEKGKVIIKDSRYETIKKKYKPYLDIYILNSKSESFANWYYEKMLLGYTYNKSLKDIFSQRREDLSSIREIGEMPFRSRAIFVGRIEDTYKGKSKNGNKYFKAVISDETGLLPTLIFKDKMDECESLNGGFPKKTNIVIVKGQKFEDAIFADMISVQDTKVFTKLSELKAIKS
tara:strand:- start:38 stop:2605 length:2568 start_codon:yes stop_codon:yes gene_type:complete